MAKTHGTRRIEQRRKPGVSSQRRITRKKILKRGSIHPRKVREENSPRSLIPPRKKEGFTKGGRVKKENHHDPTSPIGEEKMSKRQNQKERVGLISREGELKSSTSKKKTTRKGIDGGNKKKYMNGKRGPVGNQRTGTENLLERGSDRGMNP